MSIKLTLYVVTPIIFFIYFVLTDENRERASELAALQSSIETRIENSKNAKEEDVDSGVFLEPTIDSWMIFKDFAEANNASVTWIKEGFYKGQHAFYSGILEGRTKYAIAIVGKLQSEIPLVLHSININGGIAQIKISVLGVDQ